MSKNKYSRILVMLAAVISGGAWGATATCGTYDAIPTTATVTPNLGAGTMSYGADAPVGTVLLTFDTFLQNSLVPGIRCYRADDYSTYQINQNLSLFGGTTPVPGWTGQYAGALYQTDVAGIGVAIVNRDGLTNGQAITTTPTLKWSTPIPGTLNSYAFQYGNRINLVFIKTGPITPGVINAASLPRVIMTAASTIPTTGLVVRPWVVTFTGNIPVAVSTCNVASNPNVPLGKHNIETYFGAGRPNSTPWVSFNISLSGCSSFSGYYDSGQVQLSSAFARYYNAQTNYLQTTFAPVSGVLDDAKGIMRLQPVTGSATGVGIQIANDTGAAEPIPFSFSAGFRRDVRTSTPTGITLPLKARYIQAGPGPIRPGLGNGSTVFTVNYR